MIPDWLNLFLGSGKMLLIKLRDGSVKEYNADDHFVRGPNVVLTKGGSEIGTIPVCDVIGIRLNKGETKPIRVGKKESTPGDVQSPPNGSLE